MTFFHPNCFPTSRLPGVLVAGLLLLFVSGVSEAMAQPAQDVPAEVRPGDYVSHRIDDRALVVEGEGATARVTFYRPDIVRVDWHPPGQPRTDTSLAVIARPTQAAPAVYDDPAALTVRPRSDVPGATVTIQKTPLRIHVASVDGQALTAESDVAWGDSLRALRFDLLPDTQVYGSGERAPFALRGRAFDLKNTQHYGYSEAPPTLKINVPLLVTSGGYGLFVDNAYPARLDVGKADSTQLAFTAPGGPLTYYVLAAPSVEGQLAQYTDLTGRPPMPPKWALGYLQSKMGYRTEAEARCVVDTLRQKQFPVDAMILDLYWFEHMGDLRWNRDAFPTPFAMMRDFRDQGIHTVAITETYLTAPSRLFRMSLESGYVGFTPDGERYVMGDWWSCDGCDVALLDLTDPEVQDWWWRQHPPFMGDELAGLWTDLGEPEKHPMDMQHHAGPAPAVHNTYNLRWAQTVRDGWRDARPGQRLFNLTRAGSAGIQRYGTFLWSGDVARAYSAFQDQIPLMLNAGLSGLPFYGSDLGGYTGDASPELFARWLQQGALSPTMRVHGVDNEPTEPWRFGAQVESIVRESIRLRYRLMPYLYTLAYDAHRTGVPLARPLFFADPTDPRLAAVDDAYLLGDALLVAPVLEEGARSRDVVLPSGTWLTWETGAPVDGGRTVTVDAPLDRLPLFVKAGSILPTRPVAPSTTAQPADTLGLSVYPHATRAAQARIYEDDGASLDYRTGAYAVTPVTQTWGNAGPTVGSSMVLTVGAATGTYDGQPDARTVQVEVLRLDAPPTSVRLNGESLPERSAPDAGEGWAYDADHGVLHVQFRTPVDASRRLVVTGASIRG